MSKDRQAFHQVPVPVLQSFPPLAPKWDSPVVYVLSRGMHAVVNGCFSLFFSSIQYKDFLVRLISLNHSCARLVCLPGSHYFEKQLSTQETDLPPLSTVFVASCGVPIATFVVQKTWPLLPALLSFLSEW